MNLLLRPSLHIVIFKIFVKSMTSCLLKLKVTHYFAFKIPDNPTATNMYIPWPREYGIYRLMTLHLSAGLVQS